MATENGDQPVNSVPLEIGGYLTKQIEADSVSVSVEDYLEELTSSLADELQLQKVREIALAVISEAVPGADLCFVSNEVGLKLYKEGLYLAAAEAYGFSFAEENPYNAARAIYASGFVNAVHQHLQSRSPEAAHLDRDWLKAKRPLLSEARQCIILFKNQANYQDAYEQIVKQFVEGESFKFADESREQRVVYLADEEGIANSVLRVANMLQ